MREDAFLSQRLTQVSAEEAQALAINFDSTPCLFKLGNAFFDFTPFKLASNLWPTSITNQDNPFANEHLQYNFTWCQLISDTTNVTSG